ncbi:MAG TPA: FAD-dependent oxidoreductase [Nitrososphaera sp.]|jgi:(S)-2-hydroxyglutarate dehydrogenase|nr:FAD-dependent oxidoreductase [Nitrososphaera sp.]
MLHVDFKVAIIGGGVLGVSIAYFLSSHTKNPGSIVLLEQETNIAQHSSSRNTGKVHAPFLYDPVKKKTFAKAAALGYEMWQRYSNFKKMQFRHDGVLEVALDEKGVDRLYLYLDWGIANGLTKNEIQLLDKSEVVKREPNVQCVSAIYCSKDASVSYGAFTNGLLEDIQSFGGNLLLGHKVERISTYDQGLYSVTTNRGKQIRAEYLVNVAGGNSMDIAQMMGVAKGYTDIHFRGEYWLAPPEYHNLTKLSIYSVPKHPEYPFLDPHWIVRADNTCEVGPNAVPVFGPYAYNWRRNLVNMLPKIMESSHTSARKIFFDRQFLSLVSTELKSSLSKTMMINRVREFLPSLRPSAFTHRGTAGIRSSVIDKNGRFIPDTLILERDSSLHVLNYNSPGATGALPMAASIASKIIRTGVVQTSEKARSLWDAHTIADRMKV